MSMSSGYGPPSDKQAMISLIRTAVERGVTLFDTAQVYGPFTNEELMGEALAPVRDQVVIATKFGFDLETGQSAGLDSRPETIKQSIERSLQRLQGKGFLTGKIDETTEFASGDFRNSIPRFDADARKANRASVELLARVAERKDVTPAQIALAWLLAQKPWVAPIPGTTKLHRLEENIAAADLELTPDDLFEIDSAASQITPEGARYPESSQRMVDR